MLQALLIDGIKVLLLVTAGPCLGRPLQELVHAEWGGAAAGHAWDVRQVTWQGGKQGLASMFARVRCVARCSGRRKCRGGMVAREGPNCCWPRLGPQAGHLAEAAMVKPQRPVAGSGTSVPSDSQHVWERLQGTSMPGARCMHPGVSHSNSSPLLDGVTTRCVQGAHPEWQPQQWH